MLRNLLNKRPSRRRPQQKRALRLGYKRRTKDRSIPSVNTKRVKYAFYIISFLIVISFFYVLVTGFSAYAKWKLKNPTQWDGKIKQNIMVVGLDEKQNDYSFADLVMIVSVDPHQKKVGIFSLDPDIAFAAPDSRLTTFRKAYNLDFDNDNPVDNIEYGVEQVLAVDIDKYVLVTESDYLKIQELLGGVEVSLDQDLVEKEFQVEGKPLVLEAGSHELKGRELLGIISSDERGDNAQLDLHNRIMGAYVNKLNSYRGIRQIILHLDLLNNIRTDFSKTELYRLYRLLSELNSSDIQYGYTEQASLENKGSDGKLPVFDRIDKDVQSIFLDTNVLKEQSRLEVLNGTNQAGVASKYSRFFDNSGIRVVRSGNSIRPTHNTTLYVPDISKYPYTIEEIVGVFDDQITVVGEEYKYKHVGDMVLVIGSDFIDKN